MPPPDPPADGTASPPLALRALLLATLGAVGWLVAPFADALLIASVAAILAWPLHARLVRVVRAPRAVVTGLTVLALTVGVVSPVAGLAWLVTRELSLLAAQLATELDRGDLSAWFSTVSRLPVVAWLVDQAGGAAAVTEATRTAARDGLLGVATDMGQYVPGLVGVTARVVLKVAIFYLALATLFHRGDALAAWARRMSPLEEAHTTRLFSVFAEFSRNVVFAGLVAAAVQGGVAGIGYWLGGVDRPLLFALLTGVLAFVPLVGSAGAWVPIALLLPLQGRTGAALFVVAWSLALTGTVDNLVKPLIVRGRSDMPALLVFLGVFGGLLWLGVIGLLVGPVLMALLLALFRIYGEGLAPGPGVSPPPPRTAG